MQTVAVARHAMATRFEIVLHGEDSAALRAAGEEALDEIERLHRQLNLYDPASELSHINARAAKEAVRVEPSLFALLRHAQAMHRETGGLFDITIAPLMRCWGFMGGTGKVPSADELAEARSTMGMHWVDLDAQSFTVRFARSGVMLDLGSIGKGYALDQASEILREAGVESALLHGGTSTAYALGLPPEGGAWKVAIEEPPAEIADPRSSSPPRALEVVSLRNEAMSVSALHGKAFLSGGRQFGHVIDPRSAEPAQGASLAALVLPSATETDAFSTALLILGSDAGDWIAKVRPEARGWVLVDGSDGRTLRQIP